MITPIVTKLLVAKLLSIFLFSFVMTFVFTHLLASPKADKRKAYVYYIYTFMEKALEIIAGISFCAIIIIFFLKVWGII
jgi:hypothetical protein